MSGSWWFALERSVPLADAEMTLHLAMFAVEGLAGRARVHLDGRYRIDFDRHAIHINASSRVGRMVARIFAHFLLREFGEEAFRIERITDQPSSQPEEITT